MGIKKIAINNFTVFREMELDVCSGINVFIGINGTGKTHLLKGIYAICEALDKGSDFVENYISRDYFEVNPIALARSIDLHNLPWMKVLFHDSSYGEYKINMHKGLKLAADGFNYHKSGASSSYVFIPSKDILTHASGFMSLYDNVKVSFDKSYYNIVSRALLPQLRETSPIASEVAPLLKNMINGEIQIEHDSFFVYSDDGKKTAFAVEAEGFKKMGLLWQLLMNGSINSGTILLWDEPEANINPIHLPALVDVLLALQRHGVQLFLATHNYFFAKYVEAKMTDEDAVLFHSLYHAEDGVQCESSERFSLLENNPIIAESVNLYKAEIKKVVA